MYDELIIRKEKMAVVGLGYVGMPIAFEFAKHLDVIGFDTNERKINTYLMGIDPTGEVGNEAIKTSSIKFTSDNAELRNVKFFIIAVPTPVNEDKTPNLEPVEKASRIVGRHLSPGCIVVYESTVYPGVTESVCSRILEEESGMICGENFYIGYSPERINPGDKEHRLTGIKKIVAGMNSEITDEISKIYELIILAGVHKASCIKVAEAAKVVENSQRDINIAFMNELAMAFDKMNIDTREVMMAMNTKWNALGFAPGLVGGHCIGVDPYYFIYQSEQLGYHSKIIAAGRKINNDMGKYIAKKVIMQLIRKDISVRTARIGVFGITFKENCPDTRNTRVMDIIRCLGEYDISPLVYDPIADEDEVNKEYGVSLSSEEAMKEFDCCIFSVSHREFMRFQKLENMNQLFRSKEMQKRIIIDVKGMFNRKKLEERGYQYWRL